jgi:hypothetical protein
MANGALRAEQRAVASLRLSLLYMPMGHLNSIVIYQSPANAAQVWFHQRTLIGRILLLVTFIL